MSRAFILLLLAGNPGPWEAVETTDGVTLSQREIPGERVVELRAVTTSALSVDTLCTAAYGDGTLDKDEPDITLRKVLYKGENDRICYEQVTASVVSNRDYAVHTWREPVGEKGCRVRWATENAKAPPLPDGFVRIERMHGSWTFEPTADGKTNITYLTFADAGGSVPVVFVEGPRKKGTFKWVKVLLARASRLKR